jgi:hypothetical protein
MKNPPIRPTAIHITVNVNVSYVDNEINGSVTAVSADLQKQIAEIINNTIQPPESGSTEWYKTWWGITLLTVAAGLFVAGVSAYFGWS